MSTAHWGARGIVVGALALFGCEAILGTGSLQDRPSGDDGGSDATMPGEGGEDSGSEALAESESGSGSSSSSGSGSGSRDASGSDSSPGDAAATSDAAKEGGADVCVIAGTTYSSGAQNPANACESCQPSSSTTAWSNVTDGTSCMGGPPDVCHAGACAPGCVIAGTYYSPGTTNPSNQCERCLPGQSTSAWSVNTGGACGSDSVCNGSTCESGCWINGFVAPNAFNSNDPCQQCLPATSTTGWSNVADGTSCGTGVVCAAGQCGTGCTIGGTDYASGATNPSNLCQSCQPSKSQTTWTSLTCASGQECSPSTGQCVCDVSSCPDGCCVSGTTCVPWGSESGGRCGTGGNACTACAGGACDTTNGTCACDSNSCGGCCSGGTSGTCIAPASEGATACGKNGSSCVACTGSTPVCLSGGCVACAPTSTQCAGVQIMTCNASGSWGAPSNCPSGQTCAGGSCEVLCTLVVTSHLKENSPYSTPIAITYSMAGGGGAGGGGGSSAILQNTTILDYAAGGNSGASPGSNGLTTSGTFTLSVGDTMEVFVAGGGGALGPAEAGGGGGSGWYGGGGEGCSNGSATGGSNQGGVPTPTSCMYAPTSGSYERGGNGAGASGTFGGGGGNAGTGGAGGGTTGGGGGGGWGGGGGATISGATVGAGGSNGANGGSAGGIPGGLGASSWATTTTLPAAAGAGGTGNSGGNAGLVILQYNTPTGTCSL